MYKVVALKDEERLPTGIFVVVNAQENVVSKKPRSSPEAERLAAELNAKEGRLEEVKRCSDRGSGMRMAFETSSEMDLFRSTPFE